MESVAPGERPDIIMRILGLDVGSVRIGVAVSDEDSIIAQPLETIDAAVGSPVPAIEALCRRFEINTVVIGMPLSMSGGDRGEICRRARALGAVLTERLGLTVIYRDERFTSVEAERVLTAGRVRRRKRRDVVDQLAAALILQGYLDEQSRNA